MKKPRKSVQIYLSVHLLLVVGAMLFPLYRSVAAFVGRFISNCILHDRLFLYCPFCGGTRAVGALLRLDLAEALRFNPMVVGLAVILIVLDLIALVRLLLKKEPLIKIPAWLWSCALVIAIGYGVLRNYLMIAHGIDPIGDLGFFWHR